jgi:hypothetical protein
MSRRRANLGLTPVVNIHCLVHVNNTQYTDYMVARGVTWLRQSSGSSASCS